MATLGCTSGTVAAGALSTSAQFPPALRSEIAEVRVRHNIPVVAVSVAADRGPAQTLVLGATQATPLRWGSITKTVTALTVLAMHLRGDIDLSAPLTAYVDGAHWQNPWRATHPVSVLQLLELRAGFTDLSRLEFDYNQPITLGDALLLNPAHRTARWPPGIHHSYSNLTPGLTQLLIETVSGLPYAEAAKQHVFDAMGMTDSGFAPRVDLPGGFRVDGVTPIPYWHMTFPAYAALNAPLTDLNQLLDSLRGTRSLPEVVRQHLFRPHGRMHAAEFTFDYAAGLYPRIRAGHQWHTHGGDADGYRSRIAVLPGAHSGYVVNINTDNPPALRELEGLLEAYLTRDLAVPQHPARALMEPAALQALSGRYYPSSVRFGYAAWHAGKSSIATVTLGEQGLTFARNGRTTLLRPAGDHQFVRPEDPVPTVVFFRVGSRMFIQGELGNYERL